MFCENCGNQIADATVVCPMCGYQVQNLAKAENIFETDEDSIKGLIVFLSIIVPIAGWVIGISNLRKKHKKSGTVYLICGTIGFFISCIITSMF